MSKTNVSAYMPTELEVLSLSEKVVKISAYPFQAGFGITIAHPLRRLLYSSTVGFATTSVKIEGVTHEFDSMRGMLEDVAHFIINLKTIRFKIKGSENRVVANYSFKGPKEIRGADLSNNELQIVTPDAYLATLNEDAELNFSVVVEKGIGYIPSELTRESLGDGYIALDAFFTPVQKVVYDIENVLVEDSPDFEKVVFTIETDGQISPIDAFKDSLKALSDQMAVFNGVYDATIVKKETPAHNGGEFSKLLQNISELNLSVRSFNSLDKAEIKFVAELALMSDNDLKNLKNLGKKSLDEIKAVMEEIGYPIGTPFSSENATALKKRVSELKSEATKG
ncbi:MAG: DNA-directed RNA polymerase subunit alpha [Campylobacteraceae bacterium]